MQYFPFDTQKCKLKFGSWSYWKSLLNLQHAYPSNELKGHVSYFYFFLSLVRIFRAKLEKFKLMKRHISNLPSGKLLRKLALCMKSHMTAARKSIKVTSWWFYFYSVLYNFRYNVWNQSEALSILSRIYSGRAMCYDGNVDHTDVYSPTRCRREGRIE